MRKIKFGTADPDMQTVLNEFDLLISNLRTLRNSLEPSSKSSVDLNCILQRLERLRTQIACMSDQNLDWVGILQAVVCIAQVVISVID